MKTVRILICIAFFIFGSILIYKQLKESRRAELIRDAGLTENTVDNDSDPTTNYILGGASYLVGLAVLGSGFIKKKKADN